MINHSENPYEVSPDWEASQLAGTLGNDRPRRGFTRNLLIVVAATCLIGGGLAYIAFASVFLSGPILFLASFGLLVQEYICRRNGEPPFGTVLYLALMGVIFVPTVTFVIVSNGVTPSAAVQESLHTTCTMFAGVCLLIALKALFQLWRSGSTAVE